MGKHVMVAGWNINCPHFIAQSWKTLPQFPNGLHEDFQRPGGKPRIQQHPQAFSMSMKHSESALRFLCKRQAQKNDQRRRDQHAFKSLLTGKKFGPDSFAIIDASRKRNAQYAGLQDAPQDPSDAAGPSRATTPNTKVLRRETAADTPAKDATSHNAASGEGIGGLSSQRTS